MEIKQSKDLNEKQKLEIIELWNKEYPKALMLSDLSAFEDYLQNLADKHHLLLTNEAGTIMGWLMYFMRDNERNFAMILNSSLQGRGYGSKLLSFAKKFNSELNGWVIDNDLQPKENGEYYQSPIAFYKKNNFEILSDIQLKKENVNGIKIKWQHNRS